ncbi:MAG: hypothetical protein R3Y35_12535 [Clostridia bacterium]
MRNNFKGHYCKICGEHKANEKFSGKGHSNHICKSCSKLSAERKSELMALTKIHNMSLKYINETDKKWLKNKTRDKRESVRTLAEEVYNAKFPFEERNRKKKSLRLNEFEVAFRFPLWEEFADDIEVKSKYKLNRETGVLEWLNEITGKTKFVELEKSEVNAFFKWMINDLEVFCWDKDYNLENDDDLLDSFFDLPKIENVEPYWEVLLKYADETEQNIQSYNTELYENIYELYMRLLDYFEEDNDNFIEDILLCSNLIELSDLLICKLDEVDDADVASMMSMFMDIVELSIPESKQGDFYSIYDENYANIKFLQSYLMQSTAEEDRKLFSPRDKIQSFIDFVEKNFTFTNNDKVSAEEVESVLLKIEGKYELIRNLKSLEIMLFNISHNEVNSICNALTNIEEASFLSEIYLFRMQDEEIKSPLYVFLHELGHALHFYCTNNSAIIPDSFIRLSNEYLKIPLEQGLEAVEIFADAIAIGLMRIFNWDDKGTFEDMDINIKNAFAAYTDMLLKNLEKIKELENKTI